MMYSKKESSATFQQEARKAMSILRTSMPDARRGAHRQTELTDRENTEGESDRVWFADDCSRDRYHERKNAPRLST